MLTYQGVSVGHAGEAHLAAGRVVAQRLPLLPAGGGGRRRVLRDAQIAARCLPYASVTLLRGQ